jgi:hypothetical protein
VSRMMAATHAFEGAGSISGVGAIDATGNSLASLLANGDGGVKMAMSGGDLSAVLVDLTGLHFGKALLSALGMPDKTPVECFVGDLGLKRGTLDFNAFVVDTGEAIVNVGGNARTPPSVQEQRSLRGSELRPVWPPFLRRWRSCRRYSSARPRRRTLDAASCYKRRARRPRANRRPLPCQAPTVRNPHHPHAASG